MGCNNKTMLTDLYQLTMNAAYFYGNKDDVATFDLFIRALPDDWGYYIANGMEDAIDYVTTIEFADDDIAYLKKQGFKKDYLQFLKRFSFEGEIYALREGTPVFPSEPLLRVTAKKTQAQYVETALLNIANFQTMISTKANRVVNAAGPAGVVDFGLRRAHGEDAGVKGARAAYISGAVATSNVKAGKQYNIPIAGTHAHSFIMSFKTELEAFRSYVKTFPDSSTLLIDTYDTIHGARNAAVVAGELERDGKQLRAVRLDSGDLADLSKKVRKIFDSRGLGYIKIIASSDLNEYRIADLIKQKAPVDLYGVGTELITAKPVAAIPGVYKLAEDECGPKIKLSQGKETLPGKKQVYRQSGTDGKYRGDIIALEHEKVQGEPLLQPAVKNGKRVRAKPKLSETRTYCLDAVSRLPDYLKKVHAKRKYAVKPAPGLRSLAKQLTKQYTQESS